MPAPKRQAQKGMKIPPTYILPLRGGRKQEGVKKGDFQVKRSCPPQNGRHKRE